MFEHVMVAPTVYECAWSGHYGVTENTVYSAMLDGEIVRCEYCKSFFAIIRGKRTHENDTSHSDNDRANIA